MDAIDLHQHLWPEPLVELLRARTRPPYLRGWTLQTRGEPAFQVLPADHDVERRIARDRQAGIGLACLSLSAPLGIEGLPAEEADGLLAAWHQGARDLPDHFAAWASVAVQHPDPGALGRLLDGPFVGLQLPASRLARPADWEALGELLRVAELADKPVLLHPGPVAEESETLPSWWAPVVGYVAQLQASWWSWHAFEGRSAFPRLRLVFAAGAGLAPLHHERLSARGGRVQAVDPGIYVDTSSYGAQAIDGLVRALGIDGVVLGSDRPYAEPCGPVLGESATRLIRVENPKRALGWSRLARVGEVA